MTAAGRWATAVAVAVLVMVGACSDGGDDDVADTTTTTTDPAVLCAALDDADDLASQLHHRTNGDASDNWPLVQDAYADLTTDLAAAYDTASGAVTDDNVRDDLMTLSYAAEQTAEAVAAADSFNDFVLQDQEDDTGIPFEEKERRQENVSLFAYSECRIVPRPTS